MPRAPWKSEHGIEAVLSRWLASSMVKPCLCTDETLPGTGASYAAVPPLANGVAQALWARGIGRLYSHQTRAIEAALAGRHVVVATPTASGKSLCFHLPVLQALTEDPNARALYLFPTKALARDQEAGFRELMAAAGVDAGAVVYDGDTPGDARRAARERARVILTNPDMLHAGILPHHAAWARTLQNLRYVVVDELHTYRGVFGSHVANVLRRLVRIARFHGSNPQLLGATATIGNPREHAARLFGVPEDDVELVGESGAPRGERRFFLFNPPVVNEELGIRASYVKQAVMLASDLVRAQVPTIVFGQSRNAVEVMLRYLRDAVATRSQRTDKGSGIDPSRIMAYRGGYLPEQRRDIERRLREGEILGVVATNALELGIDIGELDAVVCAGYPGSVAATWQRFGRAGRRGAESICVLVASSAPLDQYLAREPAFLLGAPVEEARIDPDNVEILVQHLKCAAFELPFKRGEAFGSLGAGGDDRGARRSSSAIACVHESRGTFHWAADAYPANDVSLRSVGWDNVVIIDVEHDRSIAELDWRAAHTMLHEQAIYQHDGECWQVERFDYENHKAFVRQRRARLLDRGDDLRTGQRHRGERDRRSDRPHRSGLGDRALGHRLGRGGDRREGRRVQEDQVLHPRERRLRRRAAARDADAHDGVLAHGPGGHARRHGDRPSGRHRRSARDRDRARDRRDARAHVRSARPRHDPRRRGERRRRRHPGAPQGAGRPAARVPPDPVPLRARPGWNGARCSASGSSARRSSSAPSA